MVIKFNIFYSFSLEKTAKKSYITKDINLINQGDYSNERRSFDHALP